MSLKTLPATDATPRISELITSSGLNDVPSINQSDVRSGVPSSTQNGSPSPPPSPSSPSSPPSDTRANSVNSTTSPDKSTNVNTSQINGENTEVATDAEQLSTINSRTSTQDAQENESSDDMIQRRNLMIGIVVGVIVSICVVTCAIVMLLKYIWKRRNLHKISKRIKNNLFSELSIASSF